MELNIQITETLVKTEDVEAYFYEGVKLFKEILEHKNIAEKNTIFSFESAQNVLKQLNEMHNEFVGEVAFIENMKKRRIEYKEKAEYYRKLLSPFLDGTEEERIDALRNITCVSNETRNLTIEEAAFNVYSCKTNYIAASESINKSINRANRKANLIHSSYFALNKIRNEVLKRYYDSQMKIVTVDLEKRIIVKED